MKAILSFLLFAATSLGCFAQFGFDSAAYVAALQGTNAVIGGGSFSPADIGVVFMAEARSESYSDNDAIGTITDQSGNGHNFTATGSNRATFKTGIVNGHAVYRFDGTDDYYTASEFMTAATNGELFVVMKLNADPPLGINETGPPIWMSGDESAMPHVPYTDGDLYESWGVTSRQPFGNPTPSLSSAFRLYNVWSKTVDTPSYSVQIDTANLGTANGQTTSFNPSGNTYYIGTGYNTTYFFKGDIAGIYVFDHKLNPTERGQMETYTKDLDALTGW